MRFFCALAIEGSLIQSRVFPNFLGIYKRQRKPSLHFRAPTQQVQDKEMCIERFPNGCLLSVKSLFNLAYSRLLLFRQFRKSRGREQFRRR
jgi:hypothetical protein